MSSQSQELAWYVADEISGVVELLAGGSGTELIRSENSRLPCSWVGNLAGAIMHEVISD